VTRFAGAVATMVGVTLATFLLVHLAPGDPASVRLGSGRAGAEAHAALRRQLGLDDERPLWRRYAEWVGRTARLDFGDSLVDGRPVRERIGAAMPTTAALGFLAALLAFGVGIPLGALLGARPRWARALDGPLAVAYAIPVAALGLAALAAGAPYGGRGGLLVGAACLALALLVRIGRHQRAALTEALAADWMLAARARGLPPGRLLFGAVRYSLLPAVTLLGSELPALLSGSVLVEEIFGLPGLGRLGLDAVVARDYPTLMALATLGAVLTLGGTWLSDFLYRRIDPRLRVS
jgi:peptide/nickel transport system permease protein